MDVAVVGSGFGGSLATLGLLAWLRVALIERGRHPRFAIGESSTPLANLLLEELSDRYDLAQYSAVFQVGNLAANAARCRMRAEAWIHVLLSRARRTVRGFGRSRAPTAGRGKSTRRHRRHALVHAGLRSFAHAGGTGRGRILSRHDAARQRSPWWAWWARRGDDNPGRAARRTVRSNYRALRHRCNRPTRVPPPRSAPRRAVAEMAAADAGPLLAL